jgi:uncharacterized protein YbaR (Trm112 family)
MHSQFVTYFVDPSTHEPLSIEMTSGTGDVIESGFLCNKSTGKRFPIIRGIPRFVDYDEANYSSSNFGLAGSLRLPIAPDLATVGFP